MSRDEGTGGGRLPDPVSAGMPEPGEGEAKNTTVDRALLVLEAFMAGDEEDLSLADLSRVLNLDKSVIHRILATLVRRRFLEQDAETKRYSVGLRMWEIGQRYLSLSPLEDLAHEAIASVVRRHHYATGYVAALDGDQMVILSTVRGAGPVNIHIDPGTRLPAALTATGRVILANLPPDRLKRLHRRLVSQRREGVGEPRVLDLDEELEQIRRRGYAENRGEYFPGIGTVALCVHSAEGGPIAAISVDFPIAVETERLWEDLPGELRDAVSQLGRVVPAAPVPAS